MKLFYPLIRKKCVREKKSKRASYDSTQETETTDIWDQIPDVGWLVYFGCRYRSASGEMDEPEAIQPEPMCSIIWCLKLFEALSWFVP